MRSTPASGLTGLTAPAFGHSVSHHTVQGDLHIRGAVAPVPDCGVHTRRKGPQMTENALEQTLVLIKPDALKNSLTGYVLSLLAEFHTGLRFAGAKIVQVSRLLAEEHYAEHRGKVFYPPLLEYIMGLSHYPDEPEKRRVIALVYQGPNAVLKIREICGPTNPLDAREKKPGCIRALGSLVPVKDAAGNVVGQRMDNLIHASANAADAEREIKLWFKPNDIAS